MTKRPILLGVIADDVTGATDIGLSLACGGLACSVTLGVPDPSVAFATPAIVSALKIRTAPSNYASEQAVCAARIFLESGAKRLYYKYCSTFDSTSEGNIGPVVEALQREVQSNFCVLVPAFPENGRTVRDGVLYVDGIPLGESHMKNHPLTPMTQSSIRDLMVQQTFAGSTTVISLDIVNAGAPTLRQALNNAEREGFAFAVVDATTREHLDTIADASLGMPLLTGAAGLAGSLPGALARAGNPIQSDGLARLPRTQGNAAVLAGSCSTSTRRQIAQFRNHVPGIEIDPARLATIGGELDRLCEQAGRQARQGHVLIHASHIDSTRHPDLCRSKAASLVENAMGRIAAHLKSAGVRKFIVAGGETSGAVAAALFLKQLLIGPAIAPGVPWMTTTDGPSLCIAFKSGNFGGDDFFADALEMLP